MEAFHAFWQRLASPQLKTHPLGVLTLMQELVTSHWQAYLTPDGGPPGSSP